MNVRWFSDDYARQQYEQIRRHLEPLVCRFLGPGYELSHLGVNRDEASGEVVLRLHLNPVGRVRCAGDRKLAFHDGRKT